MGIRSISLTVSILLLAPVCISQAKAIEKSKLCTGSELSLDSKPRTVVLFKGPYKIPNKVSWSTDPHKSFMPFRSILPNPNLFIDLKVLDGEVILEYCAISNCFVPGFDGFQIFSLKKSGFQKAVEYLEENCLKKTVGSSMVIYSLKLRDEPFIWDPEKNEVSNVYYCMAGKNETLAFTSSPCHFKDSDRLSKLTYKRIWNHFSNTAPSNRFRETQYPKLYVVSIFKEEGLLPGKDINTKIEAIRFYRTTRLADRKPFIVEIMTRSDRIEDAKIILSQFDDSGLPQKSLKRIGKCLFEMEIDSDDPVFFYHKLAALCSTGF